MERENQWLEDAISFSNGKFSGSMNLRSLTKKQEKGTKRRNTWGVYRETTPGLSELCEGENPEIS